MQLFDEDSPELFDQLTAKQQQKLLNWIAYNFTPIRGFNTHYNSYSLKNLIKFDCVYDRYLYNGEFKGAMLKAGFCARDYEEANWIFNVSKYSLCFKGGVLY